MKIKALLFAILICEFVNAQNWARSKKDTASALHYAECNSITLPNNIQVDSISVSSGTIEKSSEPNKLLLCGIPVSVKKCTLFYWLNGKVISKQTMGIEPLRPPVVSYIGSSGGTMPASHLKVGQGINGYTPWGGCSLTILIQSYTVTRHAVDGSVTSAKCIGPALSVDAKKIMKMAVVGDKFTFSDIKLKDHTNKIKKHPAFTITAK